MFIEIEPYKKVLEETEKHIYNYAVQGLRTLVLAKRVSRFFLLLLYFFPPFVENEEYKKIVEDTEDHLYNYALQGLRTLCMAKRVS